MSIWEQIGILSLITFAAAYGLRKKGKNDSWKEGAWQWYLVAFLFTAAIVNGSIFLACLFAQLSEYRYLSPLVNYWAFVLWTSVCIALPMAMVYAILGSMRRDGWRASQIRSEIRSLMRQATKLTSPNTLWSIARWILFLNLIGLLGGLLLWVVRDEGMAVLPFQCQIEGVDRDRIATAVSEGLVQELNRIRSIYAVSRSIDESEAIPDETERLYPHLNTPDMAPIDIKSNVATTKEGMEAFQFPVVKFEEASFDPKDMILMLKRLRPSYPDEDRILGEVRRSPRGVSLSARIEGQTAVAFQVSEPSKQPVADGSLLESSTLRYQIRHLAYQIWLRHLNAVPEGWWRKKTRIDAPKTWKGLEDYTELLNKVNTRLSVPIRDIRTRDNVAHDLKVSLNNLRIDEPDYPGLIDLYYRVGYKLDQSHDTGSALTFLGESALLARSAQDVADEEELLDRMKIYSGYASVLKEQGEFAEAQQFFMDAGRAAAKFIGPWLTSTKSDACLEMGSKNNLIAESREFLDHQLGIPIDKNEQFKVNYLCLPSGIWKHVKLSLPWRRTADIKYLFRFLREYAFTEWKLGSLYAQYVGTNYNAVNKAEPLLNNSIQISEFIMTNEIPNTTEYNQDTIQQAMAYDSLGAYYYALAVTKSRLELLCQGDHRSGQTPSYDFDLYKSFHEAIEQFLKAGQTAETAPNAPWFYDNAAAVYLARYLVLKDRGDLVSAARMAHRSLMLDPEYYDPYYRLALIRDLFKPLNRIKMASLGPTAEMSAAKYLKSALQLAKKYQDTVAAKDGDLMKMADELASANAKPGPNQVLCTAKKFQKSLDPTTGSSAEILQALIEALVVAKAEGDNADIRVACGTAVQRLWPDRTGSNSNVGARRLEARNALSNHSRHGVPARRTRRQRSGPFFGVRRGRG